MSLFRILICTALFGIGPLPGTFAQQPEGGRITRLESKVTQLDHAVRDASDAGLVLFLFGTFCALWAQNTGRNAWLWFFLGLFFSVFTVLFLLTKNHLDNFERKTFGRARVDS